jgi:hypothetical protein
MLSEISRTKILAELNNAQHDKADFLTEFNQELSKTQNNQLSHSQQDKIFSLIKAGNKIYNTTHDLAQEPQNLTFEESKSLFTTFLRHSDDALISLILDLDSLQSDDARAKMLSCFKNASSTLNLNACHIKHLPKSILYFDHLKNLSINSNQLTFLPELPAGLKCFSCSDNQLTSLSNLPKQLDSFACDHNKLHTVPDLPASLITFIYDHNPVIVQQNQLPAGLHGLVCDLNQLTALSTHSPFLIQVCKQHQLSSSPNQPRSHQLGDHVSNWNAPPLEYILAKPFPIV